MAVSQQDDTIDFSTMYATHHAFRRDLDRLAVAAATGRAGTPQVQAGWDNFTHQLHIHHTVEDSDLWPRVEREIAGRPRDLALLAEMEHEHALIDPLLTAVNDALADLSPGLPELVATLKRVLVEHLDHEERRALPLIQEVLTREDWYAFADAMRKRQGLRGAAVYVPWIVDGLPAADRERFLAVMPAPARVVNRLFWESGYRKRDLWGE